MRRKASQPRRRGASERLIRRCAKRLASSPTARRSIKRRALDGVRQVLLRMPFVERRALRGVGDDGADDEEGGHGVVLRPRAVMHRGVALAPEAPRLLRAEAQATYQFADRAALDHGTRPENMKRLVADFDKAWPAIRRSREIMTLAQEWGA